MPEGRMVTWITLAACAIVPYAFAACMGMDGAALYFKPAPAALLALGVARRGRGPGAPMIALGLAFSAVADAVIEVSFLGGLGAFLLAHLLYVAGFSMERPVLALGRAVPFVVVFALLGTFFATQAGDMAVPIAAYALTICVMGWRASARVRGGVGRLGLLGAVVFMASDSLLAMDRFVQEIPSGRVLILGTYWTAQALIAASFGPPRQR